jgi:hypothetical protein
MDDKKIKESFSVEVDSNNLISVVFFDDIINVDDNAHRAELVANDVYDILDQSSEKKFKVLIDITKMGKSHISSKANEIYREVARREQIVKVAIAGKSEIQSKVLSFIAPFITGEGKKVLWFPDKPEANLWLEAE